MDEISFFLRALQPLLLTSRRRGSPRSSAHCGLQFEWIPLDRVELMKGCSRKIDTVVVCVLTINPRLAVAPGNTFCDGDRPGCRGIS